MGGTVGGCGSTPLRLRCDGGGRQIPSYHGAWVDKYDRVERASDGHLDNDKRGCLFERDAGQAVQFP